MDETLKNDGFDKAEADFILNCIKQLEGDTFKMYTAFSEQFPKRSPGVFLGNLLTNYIGNVLLNANNHCISHFIDGYEGFTKNLQDFTQKIVLHHAKIQGTA